MNNTKLFSRGAFDKRKNHRRCEFNFELQHWRGSDSTVRGVEGARSRSVDADSSRTKMFDETRTDLRSGGAAGFPKSFLQAEGAGEDLDRR